MAVRVVGFTEEILGQGTWEPWVHGLVHRVIGEGRAAEDVRAGGFRALTMTVTHLLGVTLLLAIDFNLLMAVPDGSGYLPRIAVMVGCLFQRVGLNGRGWYAVAYVRSIFVV